MLSLNETERNELMGELQGSAVMAAIGLMSKLPASCQQLLFGTIMGGEGAAE